MFKFKVKYKKDKNGSETIEVEIQCDMSALDKITAAKKIGISPSQIVSITKR